MALATVGRGRHASVRMVLRFDPAGFVFYTNLESRKGEQLLAHPKAALCLHWKSLRRSARVEEGRSPRVRREADAYFASRPRARPDRGLGLAPVRPLAGRFELERRVAEYREVRAGRDPRPPFWSGFRVVPLRIEFWKDGAFRLHDRLVFRRSAVEENWTIEVSSHEERGSAASWTRERAALGAEARLMRLATYASVAVAGVLIGAKLVAWLATDSVSMLSTLLDSVLDAAASLINLFAVRHALTRDREHRFGHGKAEPLAALGQSAFVAGSAVLLIVEVVRRLWRPHAIENGDLGILVMIGSILLTIILVLFQRHVVRKTGSLAIRADRLHYMGDVLVNGGVILALVLTQLLGSPFIDPVFGAAIAAYILYTAWSIARSSLDMLMDRELPIRSARRSAPSPWRIRRIKALHELRTRASGPSMFIQFHLEMDGGMSLYEAHQVADQVEEEILAAYPDSR